MYCKNCGMQLEDNVNFCPRCGTNNKSNANSGTTQVINTSTSSGPSGQLTYDPYMLETYSKRLFTYGVIWLIIAILQISVITVYFYLFPVAIVGLINLICAIRDISYSKSVLKHPVGIVDREKGIAAIIISIIYNFFIGGVIGAFIEFFYLAKIRSLVMDHQEYFGRHVLTMKPSRPIMF